jgi:hypothetical protein
MADTRSILFGGISSSKDCKSQEVAGGIVIPSTYSRLNADAVKFIRHRQVILLTIRTNMAGAVSR